MSSKAKVLFFDIESSPNVSYTWGKYDQNVIEFLEEGYLLCVAYKWLGQKKAKVIALDDFEGYSGGNKYEKRALVAFWKLLDEADIVIGHNGDRFDIRKLNAYFLRHDMQPPSPYKSYDTLKVARKNFMLNSNKLDDLGQYLGVGTKAPHSGFETWRGCMNGDPKAWKVMKKYAKQDVDLLEEVYHKLKLWDKSHPSFHVYSGQRDGCPTCGSYDAQKRGWRYTNTARYQSYCCNQCHRNYQSTKAEPHKGEKTRSC